jgi:hypothetical protein
VVGGGGIWLLLGRRTGWVCGSWLVADSLVGWWLGWLVAPLARGRADGRWYVAMLARVQPGGAYVWWVY